MVNRGPVRRGPFGGNDDAQMRVDRFAPCHSIFLVDQLGHGNLGEIGIAHELSAIVKCAPKCLRHQVDGISGAVAELRQIVTFQDIECFDQRDPAGRRRRRTDDLQPAVGAAYRFPFFYLVAGQVGCRDQPAATLHESRDLARHAPLIKVRRVFGEALQRPR